MNTNRVAINTAIDDQHPFNYITRSSTWWCVVPFNMDRLPKEE